MSNKINLEKVIWELADKLRGVLYYKNIEFSIVRLMFLKYAVDNYIGASSVESMQMCAKAQKMFAMRDTENGINAIVPVLQYIDKAYGLESVLSGSYTIDEYAKELFGEDTGRQKKNVVSADFKGVLDILGSLDLEEKDGTNSLGKELANTLLDTISLYAARSAFSNEYTTRKALSKLAGRILHVKPGDIFCDFMSGVGLSTIEITKDSMPKIVNADINNTAIAISAMLYILLGYKEFKLFNDNSLTKIIDGLGGNKIFVDGPIMSKLEKTEENEYNDSTLATIDRVLHSYLSEDENALAVIALPSSPLFVTKKQAVALREEIVSKGMLKAVIALPPMWKGTAVGTNLLVISRKAQEKVIFINAADSVVYTAKERNEVSGEALLPEMSIQQIVDVLENPASIEGFAGVAGIEEIKNKDYNFIPATYIAVQEEEDTTTLEEIDNQLKELYSKLMN